MSVVVETARLSLRDADVEDARFFLELMNEEAYVAFIGDRGVRTEPDARRYIEDRYISPRKRLGFGLCVVQLRETGERIGICGLLKRDTLEHPDIGFAFLERCWGNGYALEAASASLAHARDVLGVGMLYAIVSRENQRSIKLVRRLGMNPVGIYEPQGASTCAELYGVRLKPMSSA